MSTIPPNYRNPVYHFRGASTFPSPYSITAAALNAYNVSGALFGSTTIDLGGGNSFNVKDYQYAVATDGSGNVTAVGMYFLPVSDDSFVPDTSGNPIPGSQAVDNYIRLKTGLQPTDDIFALISYMHPELNAGTIAALSTTDKNTLGFTHMGAYLGDGITSNAPVAYHNHRFGCAWGGVIDTNYGYPCNVHTVSLQGVDQATFNRNCQLVDLLTNHGLEFPGNYQTSMFRPVFINAALMYYRDWLNQEDYLMTDQTWYFYCAANKLTVLNIACNLPHNQASFQEVYGTAEGATLWQQFLLRYTNVTGFSFYYYPNMETNFTPLWKQEGLSPSDITPFTIDQYNAYDAYRRLGTPYNGPAPVLPPQGVVCDAQSTADILYEFIQIYGDPYDAGPFSTIGIVWGWMPLILQRTGIPVLEYLEYAVPILQGLGYDYARMTAAQTPAPGWSTSAWFWQTLNILLNIYGANGTMSPTPENIQHLQSLIDKHTKAHELAQAVTAGAPPGADVMAMVTLETVIENWTTIMSGGIIPADDAYNEFMAGAQSTFEKAKNVTVTNPDDIQYNILPAAFNVISNGLYSSNSLVTIQTICTAIDVSEIQLNS